MGRGRGRGHSGNRGRASFGRGKGRGGPRGGQRFDRNSIDYSKKDKEHMNQFGEQHPSQDKQNFDGPLSKKFKSDSQLYRGRGRGGRFAPRGGRGGSRINSSEDSSESDDEVTPYDQLLAMYSKGATAKKNVQIISESESESESEVDENQIDSKQGDTVDDDGNISSTDDDDAFETEQVTKTQEVLEDSSNYENAESEDDVNVDNHEETIIEEAEIDPYYNEEILDNVMGDPFLSHFEREMNESLQQELKDEKPYKNQCTREWPVMEAFQHCGVSPDKWGSPNNVIDNKLDLSLQKIPKVVGVLPPLSPPKDATLRTLHIKPQLHSNVLVANKEVLGQAKCHLPLTSLQMEIISIMSEYHDFYYTQRNNLNSDALRVAYCLHAANHVWKTRNRIVHHNAKMANKFEVPEAFRDQGFVRPKVLILAPFKDSALKIIQTLVSLILVEQKGTVANKKRFVEEYGGTTLFLPKTNPKPHDYVSTFGGNCDDNYKIGLAITKKSIKLYTGFYSSDIIVASPLGLRVTIGADGEKDRDYDFLSSIELVIMDQADIFLMQNWDHVLHIMRHLHKQPLTTHGTDFARIRPWALDGLTKYYCQTLLFSSYVCPEHNALFTRYCRNFAGCVKAVSQISKGNICNVTVQLPQVFQQFDCGSLQNVDDDRFNFFLQKVLPTFKEKVMSHTLIFVSSYFDFVRLRNHFKRDEISFVQICEYTKDKKIARARDLFFHNQNHFMLYTERAHFFRRFRLKGIGHIIFYQLPQNPHFYSELCDFIQESNQTRRVRLRKNSSVTVVYCKYDVMRLSAIVGSDRAIHMISSEKKVHAFVSGEF